MARRLPRKDVVIVGLGWTGSILAYELSRTGLEVVAIERGPWRDTATDFNIGTAPDELRYAVRHDVFLRPRQETLTMRNSPSQTALPIRKWGSFLPGNGVGGAGVHWNGQTWRFLPDDFRIRSHMIQRYGGGILPEGNFIQDWPVSYDELEPYYDKFEVHQGGDEHGPASVSAAFGDPLGRLHQSVRLHHGALHLLRLLRAVRLR